MDNSPIEEGLKSTEQKEHNLIGYDKITNSLRDLYKEE